MNINTQDAPIFARAGLIQYLTAAIEDDVVPMIWGPPGCGKSQTIEWFCEQQGYHLVHVHWGQYAIHSAAGIVVPNMTNGTSRYTMPDYVERVNAAAAEGKKVLLFLDELPNAPKDVAAIGNQILDEHRVGEFELPESCIVVAAGNRPEDGAHACNMPATSANRIAHCVFEGATAKEFIEWGESTGRLAPALMHHLQSHPDELYDFDRSRAINNTHRTHEMASRMIERHMAAGRGLVDAEFLSHLSTRIMRSTATNMAVSFALQGKTTPIDDIVADPDKALLPTERDMDAADALAANFMQMRICVAVLGDDKVVGQAVATYVARFSAEIRAAFLAMVMRRFNEKVMGLTVLQIFQQAFKSEFIAVIDKANQR